MVMKPIWVCQRGIICLALLRYFSASFVKMGSLQGRRRLYIALFGKLVGSHTRERKQFRRELAPLLSRAESLFNSAPRLIKPV